MISHALGQVDKRAGCVEKDRLNHVGFVFVVTADQRPASQPCVADALRCQARDMTKRPVCPGGGAQAPAAGMAERSCHSLTSLFEFAPSFPTQPEIVVATALWAVF